MNQKILITGGSGLLGSYLVRWFKLKGYSNITATYQSSTDAIPPDIREGVQWEKLMLPDKVAALDIMKGRDWVIHAAGHVSYRTKDKYKLLDVNQTGTEYIVNACLAAEVRHLIYIGSIGALGRETDHVTLQESTPWQQNEYSTTYGLSKYLGELEVWRGAAEGLNVSVILPSVILGTGNWSKSSLQIIEQIEKKSPWYPGGQTGYVDVRDIALFTSILLEKNIVGQRWILNGANMPYRVLYQKVALQLGLKRNYRLAPKWMAKLILQGSNMLKGGTIGFELLNQVYGTFIYDNAKSLTLDGFSYRNIDVTIREVTENYLRKGQDILPRQILPLSNDLG